jgi:hypothetical protein
VAGNLLPYGIAEGFLLGIARLEWVEGELLRYSRIERVRIELPLPKPGSIERASQRDVTISAACPRAEPAVLEQMVEEIPGLPARFEGSTSGGVRVAARIYRDAAARSGVHITPWQEVRAIGASGREYPPAKVAQGQGRFGSAGVLVDCVYRFPEVGEPLVQLVWEFERRSDPVRLQAFRMTDIPLPGPEHVVGAPQRDLARSPVSPAPPREQHPFYHPAGGTLTASVEGCQVPG